jgi:hypothetical protein
MSKRRPGPPEWVHPILGGMAAPQAVMLYAWAFSKHGNTWPRRAAMPPDADFATLLGMHPAGVAPLSYRLKFF